MQLDPRELELLARFFAKRFPKPGDRTLMLDAAGLLDSDAEAPFAAWLDIVQRAQRQGALAALGRAARSDDPDDANLREVRRLLVGDPVRRRWSVAAAGLGTVAGLMLVVTGGLTWAVLSSLTVSGSHAPGGVAAADPTGAPAAASSAAVEVLADTVPEATPDGAAAPAAKPPAQKPAASTLLATPNLPPRRHLTADHCFRKGPEIHGFWYAGGTSPGKAGDVIIVRSDVYVRTEAPSPFNAFDTRTPIQCVLYAGDQIRLSHPPISVPVDAWWVEMTGADIVVAGGQQVQSQVAGR